MELFFGFFKSFWYVFLILVKSLEFVNFLEILIFSIIVFGVNFKSVVLGFRGFFGCFGMRLD